MDGGFCVTAVEGYYEMTVLLNVQAATLKLLERRRVELAVFSKVKQSRYRPGVAQRVPES